MIPPTKKPLFDWFDCLAALGLMLVISGIALVNIPAAMIVGGVMFMVIGVFGAKFTGVQKGADNGKH